MTMIFDSARPLNPLCFTGRMFGLGVLPPAEQFPWPGPLDSADPTEFEPAFQPTAEDDQFNAETSPLNTEPFDWERWLENGGRGSDEAPALDDDDFFSHYPSDPQTWEEADMLGGAWGGHPDRVEI